ncbi:MAG: NAD-dependent dehydratase [Rhodopirellula sp.]|nr:NAD-dependent dehydratase [Rhodopirellula sp.]|tara:strand:+ start:645 stop:1643 length:999 start_codon:yes stop_codon:yes gene_type:complete
MKTALVTGADGFIGSHLVELLLKSGYKVKAFCQYNSLGSWGWLDTLPISTKSELEVILGDTRDLNSILNAMKNCDLVFHLAALIAIPYSYIAPASYVDTNITGTLNVLQACRDLEVEKIVHTSTSECYGSAQFVPITEDHPLVAQSPYAASKIAADQIALSFHKSFNMPISILRPFNTYGPRQSNRAVIPSIITQIASGKSQIKLGALSPTRDFNFVADTCKAFLAVAESTGTVGRVINACSNFEISIGNTVELIASVMNREIDIVSDDSRIRPTNSEVTRLYGDNKLIRELTDWQAEYSGLDGFKRGIELTVDWFSNAKNLALYKTDLYNI